MVWEWSASIIAGAEPKTTVITERIKYLILSKSKPPGNSLTFTEKASRKWKSGLIWQCPMEPLDVDFNIPRVRDRILEMKA